MRLIRIWGARGGPQVLPHTETVYKRDHFKNYKQLQYKCYQLLHTAGQYPRFIGAGWGVQKRILRFLGLGLKDTLKTIVPAQG